MPPDEPSEPAGQSGFLPPDPGGREPELQGAPPPPPPVAEPGLADWQPPAEAGPPPQGWQQPPPPPGWQQPPASWQQQGQWQQSPQQWRYPPPQVPDNGSAVAGFTLSVVSGGLLVVTVGFSSLVSIVCAGMGIFYSRRGRSRVDRGETPKHRGLAQAGFIVGIVSLVLSILATAFWTVFVIAYATDDEFRRDIDQDNQFNGTESAVRIGAGAARALWSLVG